MSEAIRYVSLLVIVGILMSGANAVAETVTVSVQVANQSGAGAAIGRVTFKDSEYGLIVTPELNGLEVGPHGVHIHTKPNCAAMKMDNMVVAAGAAGGHYDPKETGRHAGPYGDGHLGDLPNILVEQNGKALVPVLAPRLSVADIKSRALIIHAGADRYDNHAQYDHGKGGVRMYCGVIK